MKTTLTGIDPIPVEYILRIAQSKATPAQRRPYVELIRRWGDETNCADEARQLLSRLRDGEEIDPRRMPREILPRYRQPDIAEKLIEIVRKIDETIATKEKMWTWAHVMRVMIDEGIICHCSNNRFDGIICSMIPGKGRDNVRKNGDYTYLLNQESSWPFWPTLSHLNPALAAARTVCNQIALCFEPILTRKIVEKL